MLIAAFAMLAVDAPADPLELHAARVTGDDAYREVLEAGVARRQFARTTLIVVLFVCSGLMVVVAFVAMTPKAADRGVAKAPDHSDDADDDAGPSSQT
jgi:hypothetical protein